MTHTGTYIHPMAQVDPDARLGVGVRVGAFANVGAGVEVGDGTHVGSGVHLAGPLRLGRENRIFPGACLGFEPQDLKYKGEPTSVEVGDRNMFREHCTVHRGTMQGGGVTRVGSDNLFMVYTHVAHDCQVGSGIVLGNNATLAGHVEVHDFAVISAFTSIHQFSRVGRFSFLGAYSVVIKDTMPFAKTNGAKPVNFAVNSIGLKRRGIEGEALRRIQRAWRILVRSNLNTTQALEKVRAELPADDPNIAYLIDFFHKARRGVYTSPPPRRAGRARPAEEGEEGADV